MEYNCTLIKVDWLAPCIALRVVGAVLVINLRRWHTIWTVLQPMERPCLKMNWIFLHRLRTNSPVPDSRCSPCRLRMQFYCSPAAYLSSSEEDPSENFLYIKIETSNTALDSRCNPFPTPTLLYPCLGRTIKT